MPNTNLENHLIGLKQLESDMLEQVFNVFLNIPETIIVLIPGFKSSSVLTELKRMRQKIKNKIKIGETRLVNELSKASTSHSDFQMNETPSTKPTFSYTDIYSRERLSVNELNSIVNDSNFDSFSVTNAQYSIQTNSVSNNTADTHSNLEVKQFPCQNSYEKDKSKYRIFHSMSLNLNIFLSFI